MATKFSQFFSGGTLDSSDIPVGLQNANNAQFAYAPGGVLTWNAIAINTALQGSMGYYTTGGGVLLLTLPTLMAAGTTIRIVGFESTGWQIVQNAGQQISLGFFSTTSGVTGYLASNLRTDCVELLCVTANVNFAVISSMGNILLN